MKYGDKIIKMEGVIVEVHDGCVAIDLKGRLGYLKVPMRMMITDYPLKVGQEVDAKIIDIDFDKKRVSLSIRALLRDLKNEEAEEAPAADEE